MTLDRSLYRLSSQAFHEDLSIEERFQNWAKENEEAVGMFFRFADQMWEAGRRPIGAKLIVERMRWETLLVTMGQDYKLNNSFTRSLALLYVKAHPERSCLFRFRGGCS